MEVIVGKTAGFCYGVKNAVEKSIEELKKEEHICCLGEIVHNSKVVKKLESMGINFIENLEENKEQVKTIIRAHGVSKKIYKQAAKKGIELIDLTCPNVLKIHKTVDEYQKNGYYIFLIGNKEHPETLGTAGFCGNKFLVIEQKEDIEQACQVLKKSEFKKLAIVVQTTFSLEKFEKFTLIIKEKLLSQLEDLKIINTICNATKLRQDETEKLSKQVDYMIIIGGKNSSNTKKLYEIASKNCKNTVCIEDKSELNLEQILLGNIVGVMAGASTPKESIDEVVNLLKNT